MSGRRRSSGARAGKAAPGPAPGAGPPPAAARPRGAPPGGPDSARAGPRRYAGRRMERKSITTTRAAVSCDVCGRTLLRGEHADAFIANGSRRLVCELCTARAANEGWIREGADNTLGVRRNGPRGGRSLLERLRSRREGAARPVAVVPAVRPPSTKVTRVEAGARTRPARGAENGAEAPAPLEP